MTSPEYLSERSLILSRRFKVKKIVVFALFITGYLSDWIWIRDGVMMAFGKSRFTAR